VARGTAAVRVAREDNLAHTLPAFGGGVLIGGANFIAVKFSNQELDPLFGAALRFTAAAVLLLLISRVFGYAMPRGRAALGAALYGLLGFGVSYALMYYAVQGLGAGPTSVIAAAVPLATLVLAVLHRQETLHARGVVGGVMALAGISILSLRSLETDLKASYVIAAVLAVLAIAESSVLVKGFPKAHPMSTNAFGMTVGALFLILASLLFGQEWTVPREPKTWASLAWLVLAGSVALFWLFLFVIKRWTASASVYMLSLMPVVAVTLGALIADEKLTLEVVLGGALVLSAVYVGAISAPRSAPDQSASATSSAAR
jgi:drug/metabolite transporter (DMT)-like permease